MRYVSIDLETTGTNPDACQILQIAAVVDDLRDQKPIKELPHFERIIAWEELRGTPLALNMNAGLIEKIHHYYIQKRRREGENIESTKLVYPSDFIEPQEMLPALSNFLAECKFDLGGGINVAGKNFGTFDFPFLKAMGKKFNQTLPKFRHRIIDPAILFFHSDDEEIPGTEECLNRANLGGDRDRTLHEALSDARDAVVLVRTGIKNLFDCRSY